MKQFFKSIRNFYNKLSDWGKVLILAVLILIIITIFKSKKEGFRKGGFHTDGKFAFKTGDDIYDDFYSSIYDQLVFSNIKDNYEIGKIIEKTQPTQESIILDVGCGTGHHVAATHSSRRYRYKFFYDSKSKRDLPTIQFSKR
jgi:hypothetical protein